MEPAPIVGLGGPGARTSWGSCLTERLKLAFRHGILPWLCQYRPVRPPGVRKSPSFALR